MKRVCIHQPDFIPYLGFFHRLLISDLFIVLDDVPISKPRGWTHRDKIKTPFGERWLTLPIQKHPLQKINEVRLGKDGKWEKEHLNLLKEYYQKAPYFDLYFPKVQDIYHTSDDKLSEFNMAFLRLFCELLGLKIETVFSSSLRVPGNKNEKLILLIKAVGGTHYLSGVGAKDYLDEPMFAKEGIAVEWQEFIHPVYPQLHGNFIPNLSTIDLLFNCGPGAKEILQSCLNGK